MIVSKQLTAQTRGNGDTIDITPGVERAIAESNTDQRGRDAVCRRLDGGA